MAIVACPALALASVWQGSPGIGLLRFSRLVIWAASNTTGISRSISSAPLGCPDLPPHAFNVPATTGTMGVPRPVPSSLASKPSARRACATKVSLSKSMCARPCARSAVETSSGPAWRLPPKATRSPASASCWVALPAALPEFVNVPATRPPSQSKSVPSPPPPVGRALIVGAIPSPAFRPGAESPSRLARSNKTAAARRQSPRYPTTKTRRRRWGTARQKPSTLTY